MGSELKSLEGINNEIFPDNYIYEDSEIARKEFARAFITGNGIKTREEISELVENIEKSAETLFELAKLFGDKNQKNTKRKEWEFYISFVITDYIQQ